MKFSHRDLRRFAIEHCYRRVKQTLHWTVPKLITPEQCQRSIDLMPLLTWQLWLAKDLGAGNLSPQALTPF
jgi:hypothetical protein